MATLREWILKTANGEFIEGVVIGRTGGNGSDEDYVLGDDLADDYGSEAIPNYQEHPRGRVLSWEDAQPHLRYQFNSDHGSVRCEAIYAWTASRVIFITQYDGATWPCWVPRNPNPTAVTPDMPGG